MQHTLVSLSVLPMLNLRGVYLNFGWSLRLLIVRKRIPKSLMFIPPLFLRDRVREKPGDEVLPAF